MTARQNDRELLRTVMDVVEGLSPDRLRDGFNQIHPRVRWLTLMIAAVGVLLWVLVGLLQMGVSYIQWVNRPTVAERMAAPYDIALRPQPMFADGAVIVLPETVGTMIRQTEPAALSVLAQCFTYTAAPAETGETAVHPCGLSHKADYATSTWYLDENGAAVSVTLVYYADDVTAGVTGAQAAEETLYESYLHTRQIGTIGNYALTDMVAVDYYFARVGAVYNFTWSSGSWIYTAASNSFSQLEAFLKAFPY